MTSDEARTIESMLATLERRVGQARDAVAGTNSWVPDFVEEAVAGWAASDTATDVVNDIAGNIARYADATHAHIARGTLNYAQTVVDIKAFSGQLDGIIGDTTQWSVTGILVETGSATVQQAAAKVQAAAPFAIGGLAVALAVYLLLMVRR